MDTIYHVKKIENKDTIQVTVPGSKSITNRALMLAAVSDGKCRLEGVLFSDDSRAFLDCLQTLGYEVDIDEANKVVIVNGTAGKIPKNNVTINVRSAGTAARFLTVMLAVAGGEYTLESSEQMKKRPMAEIIEVLRNAGVEITCLEEEGHFPMKISSSGIDCDEVAISTDVSSQYASALLMAAVIKGLKIKLTGSRTKGSYIKITLRLLEQFGIKYAECKDVYTIEKQNYTLDKYQIEPDMSGACYFYAMALLLRCKVIVNNLYLDSMQGDIKFVYALEQMGCTVADGAYGIEVDGSNVDKFNGLDITMKDFSDQALTMAVVAAFAHSDTVIRDIGHIKNQESNRVQVIVNELGKMGIAAEEREEDGKVNVYITPGELGAAQIDTYDDHRVAMSFALAGLVTGKIDIKDPMCCRKTFENYFELLDEICG